MFDQTFVDGVSKTRKPITMIFSVAVQICGVCLAILAPLVFTQVLPNAQLKDILVAPAPPVAPVQTKVQVQMKPAPARLFNAGKLLAPRAIPTHINPVDETAVAPPSVGLTGVPGGVPGGIPGDILNGANPAPPPIETKPPASKHESTGPMRVGGGVAEANLIYRVQPVYPPIARSARISGGVEFTAIISKQGRIENLQLVHGHPLLVAAARDAVLQWRYRPTLLNGEPVEVVTDITVNFILSQ